MWCSSHRDLGQSPMVPWVPWAGAPEAASCFALGRPVGFQTTTKDEVLYGRKVPRSGRARPAFATYANACWVLSLTYLGFCIIAGLVFWYRSTDLSLASLKNNKKRLRMNFLVPRTLNSSKHAHSMFHCSLGTFFGIDR